MNAISIQNLVKTYANGTQALKGIDLEVKEGDFFALLGANGAGKTTTIGILTSLVNKSKGTVKVFDHDIDHEINQAKQLIGVVPQEFNFNIFEKVWDILIYQASYFGVPKKVAEKEAEKLLKALSLWDKRFAVSRTLSGGMKRRLMIARALIHKPKLLILDEPTSGVDVELRHGMWKYLKELNKSGTTILLTTHYLEEVEQLCRKVAIIKEGVVIEQSSVKSLLSSLNKQSYIVDVQEVTKDLSIRGYDLKIIDKRSLEVDLDSKQPITHFIKALDSKGVLVNDMRPKANRMEQLYLNILKQ